MKRRPSLLCLLPAPGCTKQQPSSGSCSAGPLSDGSVICTDYPAGADMAQWRTACVSVMHGTWSSGACAAERALGGCRSANGATIWLYPSQKHRPPEDAAGSCSADATAVPALQ